MGKDRVTICIKDVDDNCLSGEKAHWNYHYSDTYKDNHKKRSEYYRFGAMSCNIGVFNVKFSKYLSTRGDLFISFSVAKLYHGNNSIAKGNISVTDLIQRIKRELSGVLHTEILPPTSEWIVTKDESNIDIIDSVENIQLRMEVLKKIRIPRRRLDSSFDTEGSLYFHSGKDRKKGSAVVTIYDKCKEQRDRGIDIHDLMGLAHGMGILRIESKGKGYTVKKIASKAAEIIERKKGLQRQVAANMGNRKNRLGIVMSVAYQFVVINEFIEKCGFDKIITTKERLNEVIEKSALFSKTRKRAAKRVVRYLNGEINTISLNMRTIEDYKKQILKTGYHYVCAEWELKPMKSEDILMAIENDRFLIM
jgi:hypothetical protein